MFLIQSPQGVSPNDLGEIFQDVVDPLVDDVGGLRLGDGSVEQYQELPQRSLVHDIDLW